ELNKNKEISGEQLQNMLNLSREEKAIHQLSFDKLLSEYEVFYNQQNKMSYLMHKIAKLQVVDQIKTKNYHYALRFLKIKQKELAKDKASSNSVVDFINQMQKLINTNNTTTAAFKRYISNSNNNLPYLTIVEKNRQLLHQQIDSQVNKKIKACYQAASLYYRETHDQINNIKKLVSDYINKLKHLLIYNEFNYISHQAQIIKSNGYGLEISSLITYVYNKTLNLAYKYQTPEEIEKIGLHYNDVLAKYNNLVVSVFDNLKPKTKTRVFYEKLRKYIILTLEILENYQDKMVSSIEYIRDKITRNDLAFIANSKVLAKENKKVIDKENDSLAFQAIRLKDKRVKQIDVLLDNSNKINEVFKERVRKINGEYVSEKDKTTEFLDFLEYEIVKIIKENDQQLIKMLKLIDKEIFEERIRFASQYKNYINTISTIKSSLNRAYDNEVKYLYDLNYKREEDLSKTIVLLEQKINALPKEKEALMQAIDTQKQELFIAKQNELLQKFSDIEGNKLLSKPELLAEINKVEKRLPKDYIKLYREIYELENDYLQQYTLINEHYYETYKDYINKQIANRHLLDNDSKIFTSFDWLNTYHKDLLNIFQLNYKETLQKSVDSRDIIKEEKRKSKEKQDRIINA
ncbi:MAG: hypothetical protein RQ856_06325, partial [Candidatus Izemoplasmatales bacterium]|nr:hypothetical protein [Candidatus Izemoplasmatales bacterium]